MSTISALSAGSAATEAATAGRTRQKVLGQEDFLKILAVQFKSQDPMKPMEDTAFIAQMAQFSSLEQSSALVRDMTLLRADQQRMTANSYLGHRVTVEGPEGLVAGEVSAIETGTGGPQLVVAGRPYPLSSVLQVEPGTVTAPVVAPAPAGAP